MMWKAGDSGMVLNKTVLNNFFEILAEEFIIIRQGTYCSRGWPRPSQACQSTEALTDRAEIVLIVFKVEDI